MGIPCRESIGKSEEGWKCCRCDSHLTKQIYYIPGDFTGRMGDAVFVSSVMNVSLDPPESQVMKSGQYIVQYIHCKFCWQYVGWTYLKSYTKKYRYKEGKSCLEMKQIKQFYHTFSA